MSTSITGDAGWLVSNQSHPDRNGLRESTRDPQEGLPGRISPVLIRRPNPPGESFVTDGLRIRCQGSRPLAGASGLPAAGCLVLSRPACPREEERMDRTQAGLPHRIDTAGVAGGPQADRTVIGRRAAIGAAVGGALVLLAPSELATAQERLRRAARLVLLLRGRYEPVAYGPDLGLSRIDLNDGSYSTTKIYPVSGVPGHTDVQEAIGDFYTQFEGNRCAYDLPGGAIAMRFTPRSNVISVPDGSGGEYLQGTWELKIPEATGRYRSFVGGHNTMVDSLHFLASGEADEFCVCLISRP